MKKIEYGGYIEFETYYGKDIHESAIALNCGRNCLAYLIKTKEIREMCIPYFLCASVSETCMKYGVKVEYYHINSMLRPEFEKQKDEIKWYYLVNYYGQLCEEEIMDYADRFPKLIVDNTQAYFNKPINLLDTLYSCRKYFGVADGAYLYTSKKMSDPIGLDYSYSRMNFLMGRFERDANTFYPEYVTNNDSFNDMPILGMSKLTKNLLKGINYEKIEYIRTQNFTVLHSLLQKWNQLKLHIPKGAFMYPLYIKEGATIRKILKKEKIYVPILWPDVFCVCPSNSIEYDMAMNILPLPVDQRYDETDMDFLGHMMIKSIEKEKM